MPATAAPASSERGVQSHTFNVRFILLISVVAALGGLLFGFDTAIISGTIPFITHYFNLQDDTLGAAVSAVLIGCILGALFAGLMADQYGRRFILFICAALFAVSGVGAALSNTLPVFISARIVGGVGVGAAAMVAPMYIAETVPAQWRGRLVAIYQLAVVSGILLAYLSNYVLADTGEANWRYMFASQVVPSVIFGLLLVLVPESPRWLIKVGNEAEAQKILTTTGGDHYAEAERLSIQTSFRHEPKTSLAELFGKKYLPVISIGVAIAIFQQVTGINAILYYAPLILKKTGIGTESSLLQTIGIGIVNVLSTFIAISLVDKVGRKKFLLWGCVLMGLSLLAIALCFSFSFFENYIILVSLLVYVSTFGCTLGAVTWVYLSEIFPNAIRSLALSVATLALWLADFVVAYTFPMLTGSFGISTILLIYAGFCAWAFGYFFIKLPETKGKTLEEVELLVLKNN